MEEVLGYVIIAVVVIAFFVVQTVSYGKKKREQLYKKIKEDYGTRIKRDYRPGEYEKIRHYFDCIVKEQDSDEYIDDITWNDLDMDRVFKEMNNTLSSVGEEYLYSVLRKGKVADEELKEFDRIVSFFENNKEKGIEVEKIYAGIGRTKSISIYDFIHRLEDLGKRSNLKHYLHLAFIIASIIVLLAVPPVGVIMFITAVAVNVINYYRIKAEVDNYFICFTYLVGIIINAKKLAALNIPELSRYNSAIRDLTKELKEIEKGVFLLPTNKISGSLGDMIMEYIRMLFHVDLIKFNSMLRKTIEKLQVVDRLYGIMGLIESGYAVASYREMLTNNYGFYAKPEFVNEHNNIMLIEEGYHPLINNPVSNSINVSSPVLLTGSNASGKSTFLKTVAINALLSQTICTSVCKRYKSKVYSIYSSMSLRDNLSENESYYIVEIKSLKRIVDRINRNENILCFVDEVLRGTNTVERIAASSELLRYLHNSRVMCFAATHDIELTHILEDCFANYHFEESVSDGDVKFNYKLQTGRATTRNAIKLLGIIGFEKNIIDAAENRAMEFMKSGKWA